MTSVSSPEFPRGWETSRLLPGAAVLGGLRGVRGWTPQASLALGHLASFSLWEDPLCVKLESFPQCPWPQSQTQFSDQKQQPKTGHLASDVELPRVIEPPTIPRSSIIAISQHPDLTG